MNDTRKVNGLDEFNAKVRSLKARFKMTKWRKSLPGDFGGKIKSFNTMYSADNRPLLQEVTTGDETIYEEFIYGKD